MSQDLRTVPDLLALDVEREIAGIVAAIREQVVHVLKRRGAVLGLSGGVDSSVCVALCVRALGPDRVLGLLMPEADSAEETTRLGRLIGDQLGIKTIVEDITPVLQASGCYSRRDAAIASVVPDYRTGYKSKLVLSNSLENERYRVSSIVVEAPDGRQTRARLTAESYRAIVAATNFKQRVRKMMEYHHADRLQYAVVGTPNRLEHDQGFFVKNGDGAADLFPIVHLYKSQVYELAAALDVPDEIRRRRPTSDTFSLAQSQEEFFFSVPHETLDVCLYGVNHGLSPAEVAARAGLPPEHIEQVYRDIHSKRRATTYLHEPPLTVKH